MGAACCQCQQVEFDGNTLQYPVFSSISSSSSTTQASSSESNIQIQRHHLTSARIRYRSIQRRSQRTMSDHHYLSFPFAKRGNKGRVQVQYDTPRIQNEERKMKAQLKKQRQSVLMIGDHWHQKEGSMTPLPLVELCIRHFCSQMVDRNSPPLDGMHSHHFPSELAGKMMEWLQQHDCLEKIQFQYLIPYLHHEWSINNHTKIDSTWFDGISDTSTTHLTRLNITNCHNLKTLGTSGLVLRRITALSLEGCSHLQSTVLPELLPQCIRLVTLNLSGCRNVNDASLIGLSGLVLLKTLDLSDCPLITDLGFHSILNLKQMEILKLNRCVGLTDDAFLEIKSSFPFLLHLELARCRITDVTLQLLEYVVTLETLVIRGCRQVDDIGIERLHRLTALQFLDARHCPQLCGLRHEWSQLRVLLLTSTAFNDTDVLTFTSMPHLEELDLRSCRVVKQGFQVISQLKSLKRLTLAETALTDTMFLEICHGQASSSLVALDVSHTELTDVGTEGLQHLHQLECLSIDTPGITNQTLSYITKLKNLKRLDLFGASVSDNGMFYLTMLPQLKELEICGGSLTCRGVSIISRIKSLELLNLSQNRRIGTDALESIAHLTKLKHLNLSDTGIKTVCARQFQELKVLESLSIYGCVISITEIDLLQVLLPKLCCLRCS